MKTLTCIVIDDEPLALGLIRSYVEKTPFLELIGTYSSAVEAMTAIGSKVIDLMFLDIQMPELSGLEFSQHVSQHTRIVLTTAFSQYAIEGYKINALDYLLKPISYSEFLRVAQKAVGYFETRSAPLSLEGREELRIETTDESIFVKSDYKLLRLAFSDILYCEGLKDYIKIYIEGQHKPILSLSSMQALEAALPAPRFLRTHRSFLVNMEKVKVLERGGIVFGDKQLPISSTYKDAVLSYINARTLGR